IGDELALFVFCGVNVIAIGVAEIAGSSHIRFGGRPGEGGAIGPRGLLAHGVFGVDTAAVHEFDAIFGEVGEKSGVAVLRDIGNEIGFELAQKVGAGGRFLFCGDGSCSEKKQEQKCYADSVHRNFSGRSGGMVSCQGSGKPCRQVSRDLTPKTWDLCPAIKLPCGEFGRRGAESACSSTPCIWLPPTRGQECPRHTSALPATLFLQ